MNDAVRLYLLSVVLTLCGCFTSINCHDDLADVKAMTALDVLSHMVKKDDIVALDSMLDRGLPIDNLYGLDGNVDKKLYNLKDCVISDERMVRLPMLACVANAQKCLMSLLRHGADCALLDSRGGSILHYVGTLDYQCATQLVEYVLANTPITVNTPDMLGRTALAGILGKGNVELARWFVKKGASFDGIRWNPVAGKYHTFFEDALTFPNESFQMCLDVYAKRTRSASDWNRLLMKIPPLTDHYFWRVSELVRRGADLNCVVDGMPFVCRVVNVFSFAVTPTEERIELLLNLGMTEETFRLGIWHAEANCERVALLMKEVASKRFMRRSASSSMVIESYPEDLKLGASESKSTGRK